MYENFRRFFKLINYLSNLLANFYEYSLLKIAFTGSIFSQKCTKIAFGGRAPHAHGPAGGAYSAPRPRPLVDKWEPIVEGDGKGVEGREKRIGGKGGREKEGEEGRERRRGREDTFMDSRCAPKSYKSQRQRDVENFTL